jgi:hypothetical protein
MDTSSSDDEEDVSMNVALNRVETLRNFESVVAGFGMFYEYLFRHVLLHFDTGL